MRRPFHRSVNRNNLFISFVFWLLRCFFFSRDANTKVKFMQRSQLRLTEASDQELEISLHGISSFCCANNSHF